MAENEKTAPISSVGADEGQSIPSNSIIPQSKSEIKWLSDEMKINECRITIEVLQKNKKRVVENPNLCYS